MPRAVRALLAAAVLLGLAASPAVAAPNASDLLPDLRMRPPVDMRITYQTTPAGGNRRLLRFTARMVNAGDGPFHVHGRRACTTDACPRMDLWQRIYRSDGTQHRIATTQHGRFDVGDGHNHWHVLNVERYLLVPIDTAGNETVEKTRASKVGFCFFDTDVNDMSLPNAANRARYTSRGCATGNPHAKGINEGLSVGWLDKYPWDIAAQWIDTTGLPDGQYLICETADPKGAWLEKKEDNNEAWSRIRLTRGQDGDQLAELDSGHGSCRDQVPHAPAAIWSIDPDPAAPVPFGEAVDSITRAVESRS